MKHQVMYSVAGAAFAGALLMAPVPAGAATGGTDTGVTRMQGDMGTTNPAPVPRYERQPNSGTHGVQSENDYESDSPTNSTVNPESRSSGDTDSFPNGVPLDQHSTISR